ncbi:hypothetical protein RHMOL_Rhmol10G0255600 [Rhododendron molle]|uniref:Uncharacterized protein n=1 Tax=Rhododendron molle TaxID=49168 RepID=A0ACC0M639_RHOML|nr:hypothetical protein RHMOL_Rhmol10G0255600 [Rhododendron molle]
MIRPGTSFLSPLFRKFGRIETRKVLTILMLMFLLATGLSLIIQGNCGSIQLPTYL